MSNKVSVLQEIITCRAAILRRYLRCEHKVRCHDSRCIKLDKINSNSEKTHHDTTQI